MGSLLNPDRPPVFCPGCAHERVVQTLDKAFERIGQAGEQVAIVTDIGCSGLFDTFFNTHAFHGLHGRALTYATGLKMARPELTVIVTMGDGGLGIGGAHVLSTCRRNIDLTLLVLNNFNYGMTGGQCSATTPMDAQVGSGFLNRLEKPLDICAVAGTAGAGWVARASTYENGLIDKIETAIKFEGFALVDIWGVCPGRYTRHNRLTPKAIQQQLDQLPSVEGFTEANKRPEYGHAYRLEAAALPKTPAPVKIEAHLNAPQRNRQEVVLLGGAGQRIVTAGELLCLAGACAGLQATQKNDYPITVMRGHSISELILSQSAIGYTGIEYPTTVIALDQSAVERRRKMFSRLGEDVLIIQAAGVNVPDTKAKVETVDFKADRIKSQDWALTALALLAKQNRVLSVEMLQAAVELRFKGKVRKEAETLVEKVLRG